MKIVTIDPTTPTQAVRLSTLKAGDVFRFANVTYEDALKADTFYFRVANPDKDKDGRCFVVSTTGTEVRVFDGTHFVVTHDTQLLIPPRI